MPTRGIIGPMRGPVSRCLLASLAALGSALACATSDPTAPAGSYGCKQQDNSCQCGDRAKVALIGDVDVSACPGAVPAGPYRCCRGADRCVCEPYICRGDTSGLCFCGYAIGTAHPSRCLTVAEQVAEQSSDPAAGDHCCASPNDDTGGCRCQSGACDQSEVEVPLCSADSALSVCPVGTAAVTSCTTAT